MRDQATELRNLVMRSLQQEAAGDDAAPHLLLMTGGKGGVGTTTLAVNLSVAIALNGWRVVLVDADLYRADVAPLCGLKVQNSAVDIISARRDIHEVLQLGPAGMQVVPGLWAPGETPELSEMRQHRLTRQLRALRRHADVVVLDGGNGSNDVARRFWSAADQVVVTTTPDSVAVMDCYAAIKTMTGEDASKPVWLVVNQVAGEDAATDVHLRVDQSCHRFLQRRVSLLGHVSTDPKVAAAADAGEPLLIHSANSTAAEQIQAAASILCGAMETTPHDKSDEAA